MGRMPYSVAFVLFVSFVVHSSAQGPLTPPGAPTPTMKTLEQIEPRTPISQADMPLTISAPGSYYLTTNLTGTAGSNGISIKSDEWKTGTSITDPFSYFELKGDSTMTDNMLSLNFPTRRGKTYSLYARTEPGDPVLTKTNSFIASGHSGTFDIELEAFKSVYELHMEE